MRFAAQPADSEPEAFGHCGNGERPLVAILIAFLVGYRRSADAFEAEVQRSIERGEPIWFRDLAPPRGDPSGAVGQLLAARLSRFTPVLADYFRIYYDEPEPKISLKDRPQVLSAITANRAAVDEIIALTRRGECRFPSDYQTGAPGMIGLPHVQNASYVVRLLAAEGWMALERGEDSIAIENVLELLDLARSFRHEPWFMAQMKRVRIAGISMNLLQGILARRPLATARLDEIDRHLAIMEEEHRLAPAVLAERAALMTTIQNLGTYAQHEALALASSPDDVPYPMVQNLLWGSPAYGPWRMHEQIYVLQTMRQMAELVDEPGPDAARKFAALTGSFETSGHRLPLRALFFSDVETCRSHALALRQRLANARLALELERYRAEHHRLPDSLDELPRLELPVGLFSGKPLLYLRDSHGFSMSDTAPLTDKAQGKFSVVFRPAFDTTLNEASRPDPITCE